MLRAYNAGRTTDRIFRLTVTLESESIEYTSAVTTSTSQSLMVHGHSGWVESPRPLLNRFM